MPEYVYVLIHEGRDYGVAVDVFNSYDAAKNTALGRLAGEAWAARAVSRESAAQGLLNVWFYGDQDLIRLERKVMR